MASMIEKYPKLVQKFALQPLVAYDLMIVWEENCVDLLLNDELVRRNRNFHLTKLFEAIYPLSWM